MRALSYKYITWLMLASMAMLAAVVSAISIVMLYQAAYKHTLEELEDAASSMARLIEASIWSERQGKAGQPQTWDTVIKQFERALAEQKDNHHSQEAVIGRLVGDQLQIVHHRIDQAGVDLKFIELGSVLAIPARRAISGETGHIEAIDYQGITVLAGYAPVPSLRAGVVMKVNLSEMRAPYIKAGFWAIGMTLLLLIVNGAVMLFFVRPTQRRSEENEERLRNIVNTAMGAVIQTNAEGVIIDWNSSAETIFGWTRGEAMNRRVEQLIVPARNRDFVINIFQAYARNKTNDHFGRRVEAMALRKSGEEFAIEFTAAPIILEGSYGFCAFIRDITERNKADSQIHDSLAQLNTAQTIAKLGSWDLDLVSNKLTWSDEIFRMFEVDKSKFTASYEGFLNAIHPDDRDLVNQAYIRSLETREKYAIVHRLKMADGRIKWVRETCESFFDALGKPLRSVGTVQDITELHAVEEEQRRLASIVAASTDLVGYADLDGRLLHINPAGRRLLGLLPDADLSAANIADYIPSEDLDTLTETVIGNVMKTGQWRGEFRLRHSNGESIPVDMLIIAIHDPVTGKIVGTANISRDIREQRRIALELDAHRNNLEQLVQERTTQLREAQRIARMGNWNWHIASNAVYWSDEMYGLFGFESGSVAPSYALYEQHTHPEDLGAMRQFTQDILSGKRTDGIDYRLIRHDGSICWVHGEAAVDVNRDGKAVAMHGTLHDITERKLVELELMRSTARLKTAQQISRMGDYELDIKSGTLIWSDNAYVLLGYQPGSVTPSPEALFAHMHPDDIEIFRATFNGALEKAASSSPGSVIPLPSLDYRVTWPDGTLHWIHTEAHIRLDPHQPLQKLIGTVQDITERKMIERELMAAKENAERANKAKNEFLSRMSHELRTPMNAILGFTQVLEMNNLAPEQLEFVQEIHHAGDHLLELINELLDLSRIEAGKFTTVVQPVSVKSSTTDAVQIVRSMIAQKNITLINRCDDQSTVLADPTRLKQILVNLLSNAAKYNRPGGHILLASRKVDKERLRIAVTDTGAGISAENLSRLFHPFDRLGAEYSAIDGTGIGLALSRQLAELMGGELGVESTVDEGSTFWIDLPALTTQPSTNTAKPSGETPVHATQTRHVLYVEDNAANLRVVEAMFRFHPEIRLLTATNGEYGLELAKRYLPDIVLLDINLPGMDGYTVFDALKADPQTQRIPVIALSADAMPFDIEKGLQAGFAHYLTKPVNAEELVRTVNDVMRYSRQDSSEPDKRRGINRPD